MPFNSENFSSLEQLQALKPKTGLEGFYTPKFERTLKTNPKPFASILQDDPTAFKTIADIIGEDRAREIQANQIASNEKNPDTYSEDPTTAQVQKAIYDNLGINVHTDNNGFLKKLIKGCVDGLIVGNVELIQQIRERGLATFLSQVVSQFTTTDGWKNLFAKIGGDMGNLLSLDPYKIGKTGSEYIGMIGGAGLAGWALKKGGKAVAESGAKVAAKAGGKTTTSTTLEATGNGIRKTGEVLQAPYKAVEKVTGATLKAGAEALGKVPGVSRVISNVKTNAGIMIAGGVETNIRRDIPSSIRKQLGAVGDVGKAKPFGKGESKATIDASKPGTEGQKTIDAQPEKVEIGVEKNLYEEPQYDFLNEPEYQTLRDILPDLSKKDIIGEGENGMILVHPNNSKVLKIAKQGGDNLEQEFLNQKGFREGLKALQKDLDSNPDQKLDADMLRKFNIPDINPIGGSKGIYEMERVNGINFKTYSTILHYQEALKDMPQGWYHGMTDNQIDEFLKQRGLRTYPANSSEYNSRMGTLDDMSDRSFIIDLESEGAKIMRAEGVDNVLNLLKQHGYVHGDYHGGNIMITPDGRIHIIDFGKSKIPPKNIINP